MLFIDSPAKHAVILYFLTSEETTFADAIHKSRRHPSSTDALLLFCQAWKPAIAPPQQPQPSNA